MNKKSFLVSLFEECTPASSGFVASRRVAMPPIVCDLWLVTATLVCTGVSSGGVAMMVTVFVELELATTPVRRKKVEKESERNTWFQRMRISYSKTSAVTSAFPSTGRMILLKRVESAFRKICVLSASTMTNHEPAVGLFAHPDLVWKRGGPFDD